MLPEYALALAILLPVFIVVAAVIQLIAVERTVSSQGTAANPVPCPIFMTPPPPAGYLNPEDDEECL